MINFQILFSRIHIYCHHSFGFHIKPILQIPLWVIESQQIPLKFLNYLLIYGSQYHSNKLLVVTLLRWKFPTATSSKMIPAVIIRGTL